MNDDSSDDDEAIKKVLCVHVCMFAMCSYMHVCVHEYIKYGALCARVCVCILLRCFFAMLDR